MTEVYIRAKLKGVGKLGWFMSKTSTTTSPRREGEPVGTHCIQNFVMFLRLIVLTTNVGMFVFKEFFLSIYLFATR